MKFCPQIKRVVLPVFAFIALGACQTMGVPDIEDIMKSPEFSEDAANIATDFPDVSDAPLAPTDVRSDKQWDRDARTLLNLRDRPNQFATVDGLSATQSAREYEALRAKAQAYKEDDPASGPVQGFPDYEPRR